MRAALAKWAKALARIILRRMTASGVPVNREQRRRMARQLYRDVQRYRRVAAAAAAQEIHAEFPRLTIPPVREYQVQAVEAALARAVEPPQPARATATDQETPESEPHEEPTRNEDAAKQESATARDESPAPDKDPAESATPKSQSRVHVSVASEGEASSPREPARVARSEEPTRRPRAAVTGPDGTRRPRATVAGPNELDPKSRRQGRARVTAPTSENRTNPVVVAQVADRVSATLERHVRQAARDLTVDAAEGAGDEIGWARVLSGAENCAFCAMLASRGPVYHSDKSALTVVGQRGRVRGTRALGESYHDHCDCKTVLVRKGKAWQGQDRYEELWRLWMAADAYSARRENGRFTDDTPQRAFNRAFRRIRDDSEFFDDLEKLWDESTAGVPPNKQRKAFGDAVKQNPPAALEAARRPRRAAA